MQPIIPHGGVSWKQPCSLTGLPLHDDDDDDDDDDEFKCLDSVGGGQNLTQFRQRDEPHRATPHVVKIRPRGT